MKQQNPIRKRMALTLAALRSLAWHRRQPFLDVPETAGHVNR